MGEVNWGVMVAVMGLTGIIHAIETLQYGVSLAGIRRRRLATAGTLFGVVLLISRTANTIQGPLLGSFADQSAQGVLAQEAFLLRLRVVLLAATAGSLVGAAVLPSFVRYLGKAIEIFVRHGSYPGVVGALIKRGGVGREDLARATKGIAPPTRGLMRTLEFGSIPIGFLMVDVLVTAIFAVSVLAPLYAGVLVPDRQMTAVNLSGVINGFATALMFIVVSPRVSTLVDDALNDPERIGSLRSMVTVLVIGKILGTLLSQILLIPSAQIIAGLAKSL